MPLMPLHHENVLQTKKNKERIRIEFFYLKAIEKGRPLLLLLSSLVFNYKENLPSPNGFSLN